MNSFSLAMHDSTVVFSPVTGLSQLLFFHRNEQSSFYRSRCLCYNYGFSTMDPLFKASFKKD